MLDIFIWNEIIRLCKCVRASFINTKPAMLAPLICTEDNFCKTLECPSHDYVPSLALFQYNRECTHCNAALIGMAFVDVGYCWKLLYGKKAKYSHIGTSWILVSCVGMRKYVYPFISSLFDMYVFEMGKGPRQIYFMECAPFSPQHRQVFGIWLSRPGLTRDSFRAQSFTSFMAESYSARHERWRIYF